MYLRTPKRYRARRRRRHLNLISRRTLLVLLLIPAGIWLAVFIWDNRDSFHDEVSERADALAGDIQTQVASEPTPTATPDLASAQSVCDAYLQGASVNMEEAIEQCTIMAESRPNDVVLHYHVTHMLVVTSSLGQNEERLVRALEFAERTINADPEAPHGWAIRAMVFDWQGDYSRALASALMARALDENFAPTYAFLAEIYSDLGQAELALSYVEQAIELDTAGLAVSDAFRTEGMIYANQGDRESAVSPYEMALQQAPPGHTYIVVELANTYNALAVNTGDTSYYDQSLAMLEAAQEENPWDASVLWVMGYTSLQSGNRERAYEYYQRCLELEPENVSCLSYLGGLYNLDGDIENAIPNLRRAIELGSTDPDDYLELGRAYAAQNQCNLAIPFLEQGYQIALARELVQKQGSFINALQGCGVLINQ
ncbi:MAG: tetratricopeptide repeat protein [Chloroflexi bacterium]|nr:tetratricopeptide repeat protein [Chloroflexota bacterium]